MDQRQAELDYAAAGKRLRKAESAFADAESELIRARQQHSDAQRNWMKFGSCAKLFERLGNGDHFSGVNGN